MLPPPREVGAKADFRQLRDGFPAETIYLRPGPRYNSPMPFTHVIRGPAMTAPLHLDSLFPSLDAIP
ncbi:hypothetical protein V2A87_47300, partial [Pseudomonas aeruginosa]